jgi:hypothetical protein
MTLAYLTAAAIRIYEVLGRETHLDVIALIPASYFVEREISELKRKTTGRTAHA